MNDFMPGQRVHARRYIQPDLAQGCSGRRLVGEWDGIADGNGGMRILDGQGEYSGTYLCFDYVFLGIDVVGGSAYLVTEVDIHPESQNAEGVRGERGIPGRRVMPGT